MRSRRNKIIDLFTGKPRAATRPAHHAPTAASDAAPAATNIVNFALPPRRDARVQGDTEGNNIVSPAVAPEQAPTLAPPVAMPGAPVATTPLAVVGSAAASPASATSPEQQQSSLLQQGCYTIFYREAGTADAPLLEMQLDCWRTVLRFALTIDLDEEANWHVRTNATGQEVTIAAAYQSAYDAYAVRHTPPVDERVIPITSAPDYRSAFAADSDSTEEGLTS